MLEKIFHLKENGTNVRTEIIAGLTSFMTMAYILALNPNLLVGFSAVRSPHWNGVFLATCISAAIGISVMAFAANKPFAVAPGMGMNSFFPVVVANIVTLTGMTYLESFQAALVFMLIEGIIFVFLTILGFREKIVEAIPTSVRIGIPPAIGLMLMGIGLGSNAAVSDSEGNTYYIMRDFFGALTSGVAKKEMGSAYPGMVLNVTTAFIGLFVIVALTQKGVKAAVILGMLAASVFHWIGDFVFLGTNPFSSLSSAKFTPPVKDMIDTTFFRYNVSGLLKIGWFTIITLLVTFCVCDLFSTIGSLVGVASRTGMLDKNGKMPKMKEALLSDAFGTIVASATGSSSVCTFIESASGVEAGGRTGLTSLTTGILFLVGAFLAPVVAVIPSAATSSALIYVGILMVSGLKSLDFDDISHTVPVGLMLIAMPISGSIGRSIGIGLITFTVIKLLTGKAKEVSVLTYVLSLIFLVDFFLAI